jgi:hypothetical protein
MQCVLKELKMNIVDGILPRLLNQISTVNLDFVWESVIKLDWM